jgi:voltage-gated potassium channel
LIYTAEHDANPLFTDYFTALYFGLTTLTTVGFGDITPVTFQGRIVVMASILAGVIVVPAQAASL